MDVSAVFDVVLGVLFIFLIFSLVVSGIGEGISKLLAWRSRHLWRALRKLVDGQSPSATRDQRPSTTSQATSLTDRLYAHPLIRQLEGRLPTEKSRLSAIPRKDFSRALIDIIAPNEDGTTSVEAIRLKVVQELDADNPMRAPLLALVAESQGQLSRMQDGLGEWFDARMEFLSAAYKRHVKWLLLGIAVVVTLAFNVDAVGAASALHRDDALRTAVAERAVGLTEECETKPEDELDSCIRDEVDKVTVSLTLPVGWVEGDDVDGWQVIGWIVAVIALSQGGPFWFDVLRRASGLRKG